MAQRKYAVGNDRALFLLSKGYNTDTVLPLGRGHLSAEPNTDAVEDVRLSGVVHLGHRQPDGGAHVVESTGASSGARTTSGNARYSSVTCASRARRKVQATVRPSGRDREHREAVHAFRAAAVGGDFDALLRVFDPQVKLTVDTADGVVVPLGATKVAAGARMFSGEVAHHRRVLLNGVPGQMSWRADGTPLSVTAFTVAEGRITGIRIVIDPAKLASIGLS